MASTLYVVAESLGRHSYKIGRTSKSLEDRLRRLQTGNPYPLYYAVIGYGLGWMEQPLHAAFAAEKMAGEWFDKGGAVERFVDHLWETMRGGPESAADVFEAAAVAMRSVELRESSLGRWSWDAERYDVVASRHEDVARSLTEYAADLRKERQSRFEQPDPDSGLPSFAEALKPNAKRIES
jgi:hypothetical protein